MTDTTRTEEGHILITEADVLEARKRAAENSSEPNSCCEDWVSDESDSIILAIPGTAFPCTRCRAVWVFCGIETASGKPLLLELTDGLMLTTLEDDYDH